MGLLFFPRGGSAHVARNLATALPHAGWEAKIVSGSLSRPGRPGDARAFYRGLDVHPVDFTAALEAPDPLLADPPFHPSYEDRRGAPDRVFAALGDDYAEHLAAAWAEQLEAAGARDADVLHLHHLTPLNEAAARVAPDAPVIGHLHGTELLMLEAIRNEPDRWAHAASWRSPTASIPSSSARWSSIAGLSGPSTCRRWPATRARCCSTWGASPPSSACRC